MIKIAVFTADMIHLVDLPIIQRLAHALMRPLQFWQIALALLVLALLSYGIHIPAWGLYGDDWIYLYSYHAAGAGGFMDFVRADRPFSFWIYSLITPLLGETIYPYHVLLLLVRWIGACLLYWLVQLAAPLYRHLAVGVAVLFLIYPGFGQHPVALQFILHFTVLALTIFSFACMIKAGQSSHPWRWIITSWLAALVSLFSLEYFFGYELLRPLLLWMAQEQRSKPLAHRLRRVLIGWLPYLAIAVLFVIWRIFVFKFPFYQPEMLDLFRRSPLDGALALLGRVAGDFKIVIYDAWRQTITIPDSGWAFTVILGLAAGLCVWLVVRRVAGMSSRSGGHALVWLGLVLILAGGLPFWVTDIPVELAFPWDRSTLPFMLGAAVFTTGVLEWILRPIYLPISLALLTVLAVGYHSLNAQVYASEWRAIKDYFWQLTWRAPDLVDGTVLLSDEIPLFKHSDNDLTPIVNWSYRPEAVGTRYEFQFFDLSTRVEPPIPSYVSGQPVIKGYRSFKFEGSTDRILALHWRPTSCLRLLDPQRPEVEGLPETLIAVLPYINLNVVQPSGSAAPITKLFGEEPIHTWCFYFQKADLARQVQNWGEVLRLGREALAKGLIAIDAAEYLPFLEAAVQTADMDAMALWNTRIMASADGHGAVCDFWRRMEAQTQLNENILKAAADAKRDQGCEP